jgi:hypothetical protein
MVGCDMLSSGWYLFLAGESPSKYPDRFEVCLSLADLLTNAMVSLPFLSSSTSISS